MPDPGGRWTIPPDVLRELAAHAREASPVECCGVLIGVPGQVMESRRAANLADRPTRFLLDPRAHLEALRDSRRRGLEVVGFYHSHPHSGPVPSPTDVAEASYGDYCHVIVGLGGDTVDTRAYELRQGHFVEVILDVAAP